MRGILRSGLAEALPKASRRLAAVDTTEHRTAVRPIRPVKGTG